MLKIDLEYVKGILFVRLKGTLNKKNFYKLNNYLIPVIIKHKIKYLVYNLYNLNNIDYKGKEALEKCSLAISQNNGISLLCEIPKNLEVDFENININKTLTELTAINLINI